MVCTSLGSQLRPLFYFLCSILLIYRVQSLREVFHGSENKGQYAYSVPALLLTPVSRQALNMREGSFA